MLTFRNALKKAIAARPGLSIRKVAIGAGVSYDQLRMVLKRDTATTNVEDGVKIAAYFGMELSRFLEIPEEQHPVEIVEVYNQLPDHMRQKIVAYGKGMLDSLDPSNPEAQSESQ
jgi:lambda repressor-like predicted transcriptional regulator